MKSLRLTTAIAVAVLALLLPATAAAQWLNYPEPGVPRLPDGKANLRRPRLVERTANRTSPASGEAPVLFIVLTSRRISNRKTFSRGRKP